MEPQTDPVCEVCDKPLNLAESQCESGWCQECSGRDGDEDFRR